MAAMLHLRELRLSLRVARPQSSRSNAAGLVGADLVPSRFRRLASLLAWPNGEYSELQREES
jgi:hypothetical protein